MARQALQELRVEFSCHECAFEQLCLCVGMHTEDTSLFDRYVKRKRMLKRGEVLYRAGEPLACVYIIRGGTIKTCVSTDDGRLQITGFHISGELLGLDGLSDKRHGCDAVALEAVSICEISLDCFEEFARQVPSLSYIMLKMMSKEIKHNQEQMLLLGKKTAEERLASYLLSLSRRFALRNYSATQFNLSMSRGDIGDYLGIAEETVCRLFTRFQEEGLITTERRLIVLKNMKRLSEIAHEPVAVTSRIIPLVRT